MFNAFAAFSFASEANLPVTVTASQQKEALADIDAFIRRVMDAGGTVGMSVGVVQGSEMVYAKGFGFADREGRRVVTPDTLFYIASTSKSFTALTASLLAARGALDLNAPMSRYLPAVALAPPLSADNITIRDLLSMTHGIDGDGPVTFRTAYTGEFTNDLVLQLIRFHPALATGRKFVYSNVGYNLFGLVLDSQFKEGWKRVLRREVFEPLSMNSTTDLISETPEDRLAMPYTLTAQGQMRRVPYGKKDSNMHAAGGHLSSAKDLSRYLAAHMNGGRIDGKQALPEAPVNGTHVQQTDQDRMFGSFKRTGWALGWDIGDYDGERLLSRFGGFSGFFSHVSFMPEHGIGVVILVNSGATSTLLSDLVATYIYSRLLSRPGLDQLFAEKLTEYSKKLDERKIALAKEETTRAARPQKTPLPLSSYAGTYENVALGRMVWTLNEDHLQVKMGAASSDAEVFDGPKNMFRVELTGGGEVVTFAPPSQTALPDRFIFAGYTFQRIKQ